MEQDNTQEQAIGTSTAGEHRKRPPHPLIAGVLSAFIPGLGQAYNQEPRKAAIFILAFTMLALAVALGRLPATFAGMWLTQVLALALACATVWNALFSRRARARHKVSRWWACLYLPLACIVVYGLINLWIITVGFRIYDVPSKSMEPTIGPGESIVADTRQYEYRRPQRGEVILYRHQDYVSTKRVLGLPGDTIEGGRGGIVVNGQAYSEPYVIHTSDAVGAYDTFGPLTVPPDELFVLGDNRDVSYDSRAPEFGHLHIHDVLGRALYILRSTSENRLGKRIE